MKKTIATFLLLIALSFSIFAEGEIPIGGKSCPNGQTTCLVAPDTPDTKTENPIYKGISVFLKYLFG